MPSEERISVAPFKTVILLSLLLMLSGNWILPLMDRDEPKFAEASREMLQRNDFIIPWFNGQYRFDKPPLIYWCQAVCYKLLGQNIFSARFPSALFATATAILLLLWGRRLGNEKTGFYAAIMFITCLQVLIHGRLAVADMPMVFFVTAATWSAWELTRPQTLERRGWWWMFFGSLGIGFLAKGPVAWLPLVGVLLGRWLRPAEFRAPWLSLALGMVLVLFVVGLWGVPALIATNGQFFTVGIGHHVVFRSLGIMEGHGGAGWIGFVLTLPLYFLTFFFSFFPWALKMPGALRQWWSSRGEDSFGWYLIMQAAIVFAVFSLVRTKLPHYTLPAFPVISLWLARQIAGRQGSVQWLTWRAGAMSLFAFALTLGLFFAARPYFVAAKLYKQVRPFCSASMEFATVSFDEPSLVWEFRRVTTNYMEHLTVEQARPFLQKQGARLLILPASDFNNNLKDVCTNMLVFHSAGIDTARFRRIELIGLLKPEGK